MIPFLPLLLNRVPFLGKIPWKLVGYGLVVLAVSLLLWRIHAWRDGYLARKEAVTAMEKAQGELADLQKLVDTANGKVAKADAAYQRTLGERDAFKDQVTALLNRQPIDPKTLIVRVPTDAPGITCPDRSPDFRLRYNEIASTGNR